MTQREVKRVAVTGATGFLGSHLVDYFLDQGCQVRALARDAAKAKEMRKRVEAVIVADIADRTALDELVAGCDTVVHTVSNFRAVSGTPESYYQTNVLGTRHALEAAIAGKVGRFVHCSTIGVHGHVRETPATEESPYHPGDLYQETKYQAEKLCREQIGTGATEIVIVRPTSQYGPGDMRMLKMFRMLRKRRFVLIGPCRENFHAVYIDDLVRGFWQAMTVPGIGGEVFLLGGPQYVSLADYIKTAAAAVGAPVPWMRLPYWPMFYAAWLCELLCAPLGVEPPLHRRRVRFFRNNRAFDITKARERLGYAPQVDLEEGMRRTVEWYRAQGLL